MTTNPLLQRKMWATKRKLSCEVWKETDNKEKKVAEEGNWERNKTFLIKIVCLLLTFPSFPLQGRTNLDTPLIAGSSPPPCRSDAKRSKRVKCECIKAISIIITHGFICHHHATARPVLCSKGYYSWLFTAHTLTCTAIAGCIIGCIPKPYFCCVFFSSMSG